MAFRVVFTPMAENDLDSTTLYIALDSGAARAAKWRDKVLDMAESLDEMPARFAVWGRVRGFPPIRSVGVHSHRILYTVDEASHTVRILRLWHMARRDPRAGDLRSSDPPPE